MSEKILIKDLQKLDPGSELIQLFEIEYAKNAYAYAMSGVDSDLTSVQMRDFANPSTIRTYTAIPMKADGFETKNDGAQPKPTISIANATTAFTNAITTTDYDSLVGLKVIRRLTLKKYLYGESEDANPPVEYPRQIWYIDRIKSRNKIQITLELASPFDLSGIQLPGRSIVANRCPFIFQGASDHLPEYKKAQSGCTWNVDGKYKAQYAQHTGQTEYTVHANPDDEYVIPSTTSFATYSSGAVTKNSYYKTQIGATRFNANGTTTSVTKDIFWQATETTSNPGTPTVSNSNFNQIRIYRTYSHGTEYFTYSDDRLNDYVLFTDNVASSETYNKTILWKAKKPSQNVKPDFGLFWQRGDTCSKSLEGCKLRFGFNPKSIAASATGRVKPNTAADLPFGGFPAAKAFS